MLDLSKVKKIRFLGIGGVSMSSLARFFKQKGFEVTGSDREYSDTVVSLNEEGISVTLGFDPEKTGIPDLAVYSSALPSTDVEIVYLKSAGVPVLERRAFLPYLCSFFKYVIAVGGTHGKTTVTSMCATVMKEAGLKFYPHVGGESNDLGKFYYSGDDYLLIEACEYRRSMLSLSPTVAVVLNAEVDHPDTYRDKSDVFDAFDDFLISSSGLKIVDSDSDYYLSRQKNQGCLTYGSGVDTTFRAVDVKQYANGCFGCCIYRYGIPYIEIKLAIPGRHILEDALACVAVCSSLGIDERTIKKGLEKFSGVKRRFEYKGRINGGKIFADYAHHPTEITQTLITARQVSGGKITAVFQPHTYSRTARLKKEFCLSLKSCDRLIIVKEYAAREVPSDGCSALALFRECGNPEKYYADNLLDAARLLKEKIAQDDTVVVLGAGNIIDLCDVIKD